MKDGSSQEHLFARRGHTDSKDALSLTQTPSPAPQLPTRACIIIDTLHDQRTFRIISQTIHALVQVDKSSHSSSLEAVDDTDSSEGA